MQPKGFISISLAILLFTTICSPFIPTEAQLVGVVKDVINKLTTGGIGAAQSIVPESAPVCGAPILSSDQAAVSPEMIFISTRLTRETSVNGKPSQSGYNQDRNNDNNHSSSSPRPNNNHQNHNNYGNNNNNNNNNNNDNHDYDRTSSTSRPHQNNYGTSNNNNDYFQSTSRPQQNHNNYGNSNSNNNNNNNNNNNHYSTARPNQNHQNQNTYGANNSNRNNQYQSENRRTNRPRSEDFLRSAVGETTLNEFRFNVDNVSLDALREEGFNPRAPITFLIHGFTSGYPLQAWMTGIVDIYTINERKKPNKQLASQNLFVVNWHFGARSINYLRATANVPIVAAYLVKFIDRLVDEMGVDSSQIQLVGHSLGAHLAGFTAKNTKSRIGRIYGLDPAGPCFGTLFGKLGYLSSYPANKRLAPTDADEVITVVTNTELLGLDADLGQYSVFVEGGVSQPGCAAGASNLIKSVETLTIEGGDGGAIACSHSRAPLLMSYRHHQGQGENDDNDCQMVAYECENWDNYKHGHCGYCDENNSQCLLVGLNWQYPNKTKQATGNSGHHGGQQSNYGQSSGHSGSGNNYNNQNQGYGQSGSTGHGSGQHNNYGQSTSSGHSGSNGYDNNQNHGYGQSGGHNNGQSSGHSGSSSYDNNSNSNHGYGQAGGHNSGQHNNYGQTGSHTGSGSNHNNQNQGYGQTGSGHGSGQHNNYGQSSTASGPSSSNGYSNNQNYGYGQSGSSNHGQSGSSNHGQSGSSNHGQSGSSNHGQSGNSNHGQQSNYGQSSSNYDQASENQDLQYQGEGYQGGTRHIMSKRDLFSSILKPAAAAILKPSSMPSILKPSNHQSNLETTMQNSYEGNQNNNGNFLKQTSASNNHRQTNNNNNNNNNHQNNNNNNNHHNGNQQQGNVKPDGNEPNVEGAQKKPDGKMRMFLRTGDTQPYCNYQYQLIMDLHSPFDTPLKPQLSLVLQDERASDSDRKNDNPETVRTDKNSLTTEEFGYKVNDLRYTLLLTTANKVRKITKGTMLSLDGVDPTKIKNLRINYMSNIDYKKRQEYSSVLCVVKTTNDKPKEQTGLNPLQINTSKDKLKQNRVYFGECNSSPASNNGNRHMTE